MSEAVTKLKPQHETPVEAARRLEAEARQHATNAAEAVVQDLAAIAARCIELRELTSLPPGVRDLLPRIGDQINAGLEQARAISVRAS